jgi:hypothetical protein
MSQKYLTAEMPSMNASIPRFTPRQSGGRTTSHPFHRQQISDKHGGQDQGSRMASSRGLFNPVSKKLLQ